MDDTTIDAEKPKRKHRRRGEPPAKCSVEGCERNAQTKGMCSMHHLRLLRHGNTEGILDFGDPLERFHKKHAINSETGCWEWACYRHPKGYGILAIGKQKKVRAHRFAFERLVGPIPSGMLVCHHCDNRKCVNPDHLFLGDDKANARDMHAKGRQYPKPGNPRFKLSWQRATNIRVMYARGDSITTIASIYQLDEETVRHVVKGLSWLSPLA